METTSKALLAVAPLVSIEAVGMLVCASILDRMSPIDANASTKYFVLKLSPTMALLPLCSVLLVIAYYIVMNDVRLSHTAALILKALSLGYCFGFDVMEITGLPSGTVYPALRRLERDELVESKWEPEEDATANQRPARRYYKVTRQGKAAAVAATERYPLLASLTAGKRG